MGNPIYLLDDRPMKLPEHPSFPGRLLCGPSLLCTSLLLVLNRLFHRSYTTLETLFLFLGGTFFFPYYSTLQGRKPVLFMLAVSEHFNLACDELTSNSLPSLTYPLCKQVIAREPQRRVYQRKKGR